MLEGKTALISGASIGIGRRIALKYVEHGAFIGINYVSNDNAAKETLQLIRENGGDGVLLKGDVSDAINVERIVNTLIEKRERIDILVNNAGIYIRNIFENIQGKTWEKILSVNLTSCYYLCKQVITHMNPNGKIIFISSFLLCCVFMLAPNVFAV